MKKYFIKSNLLTLFVLAFVLWRQLPILLKSFEVEGIKLESKSYSVISAKSGNKEITFPPVKGKALAIFWATWCRPCKIEMQRLQTSIEEGKIVGSNIVAINPFEDLLVVKKFLASNKFDFTFIEAPEIVRSLDVKVIPTTVFLDSGNITSHNTGMSIIGIWNAERFLD